jgi:hypothetical protein
MPKLLRSGSPPPPSADASTCRPYLDSRFYTRNQLGRKKGRRCCPSPQWRWRLQSSIERLSPSVLRRRILSLRKGISDSRFYTRNQLGRKKGRRCCPSPRWRWRLQSSIERLSPSVLRRRILSLRKGNSDHLPLCFLYSEVFVR